jgi:hypothetical protein
MTPYILYSATIRRVIADAHKTSSFGEISRLVADKVRSPDLTLSLSLLAEGQVKAEERLPDLLLAGLGPRQGGHAECEFCRD